MRTFILAAMLCILASGAMAVSVKEQVLQSGQYARAKCTSDPKVPDYNECICDADIRYPQLSGVSDAGTQEKLNAWFKGQAAKASCDGDKVATSAKDTVHPLKTHMSMTVHYETTFSSPDLVAFRFIDSSYTGGAHGNGAVIGVIIDLAKGQILTPTDIFSPKDLPGVNDTIYAALSAKPEEEIFRDQIESRKGAFIKDGECDGCTLILTPEGVHVLFQTYEVAPYGAGNTDVLIPTRFVNYRAITNALAAKQAKPEKK